MLTEVAERVLRERWPEAAVSGIEELKGSERNTVVRAQVTGCPMSSVIVKLHLSETEQGAVREPAALSLLTGLTGQVQLVGVSTAPPAVVLEDLGEGTSVADALLSDDPRRAQRAVLTWARGMADLHRLGAGEGLSQQLDLHADRIGRPVPASNAMPEALARAADTLTALAPTLGVTPPGAALDELRHLDELLGGGVELLALTPSDACPDNNVLLAQGLVLLDFEGAQVRHVAWDVAYLTVPWPSCWCSWRIPAALADEALAVWRQHVGLPYATTDAFDADLITTGLGWAVISASWFLASALESADPEFDVMPARRAMIQHRLAHASDPRSPALTAFAAELLEATRAVWGEVPLELAPAFRHGATFEAGGGTRGSVT